MNHEKQIFIRKFPKQWKIKLFSLAGGLIAKKIYFIIKIQGINISQKKVFAGYIFKQRTNNDTTETS